MNNWQTVKLGDCTEIARGSSPRPINDNAYFYKGTIPWVKIADATASFKYIYETKEYVNEYGASFSRKLPPGSLIVAASGTLGFAIFLGVEGCVHDGWMYFKRIDEGKLNKQFLYYLLNTLTKSFNAFSYGAAIQNINTDILRNTEFRIPTLNVQKNIAAIFSAYDELIENNQRRIALLEKMAEEIYREWFVRMRFPGREKVKIIKGVPEDWEVKKLGSVLELCYGKALKDDDRVPGEFHVYGSSGVVGTHNEALVKTLGLIVGRKGNVGSVYWSDCGFFPIDTVYYVKSELPNSFLYFLLRSMNFINNDAAVPGLNRSQAYSNLFFLPPPLLIKKYAEIADSQFKMKRILTRKNEYLTLMRDKLLPRLISGKLSVEHLDIQFPPGMEETACA